MCSGFSMAMLNIQTGIRNKSTNNFYTSCDDRLYFMLLYTVDLTFSDKFQDVSWRYSVEIRVRNETHGDVQSYISTGASSQYW